MIFLIVSSKTSVHSLLSMRNEVLEKSEHDCVLINKCRLQSIQAVTWVPTIFMNTLTDLLYLEVSRG